MNRQRYITVSLILVMILCVTVAAAQKRHTVVFYNMENFFDTINDPDVNDEEFLPNGPKAWNTAKYTKKLENVERVLWGICSTVKDYPAVIGVSEVENRNVLEDLVVQGRLANANYQICHYDSPDLRGIDVAFLYRPDRFEYEGSETFPVKMEDQPDFKTRDIVVMWGKLEGEDFCFMVAHWPSRSGGAAVSAPKRMAAAKVMRGVADSIYRTNPDCKIVMMGDLNDDPTDRSIIEGLGCRSKMKELVSGDLFNPYIAMLKAGYGTLAYNDAWNIFDNIIVSENLATGSNGKLKLLRADGSKYYGNIYKAQYMIQQSGQYKGYPLRTFVGNAFQGGYSDHLPVYILIGK